MHLTVIEAWSAIVGVVLAFIVAIITATWHLSGYLAEMHTRLRMIEWRLARLETGRDLPPPSRHRRNHRRERPGSA